ncbi:MAG: GDSL-type esterase/lipase family protein [Candidatus Omnitrophota bacterium]|nr:GDSL-type esterase/lipase family protein [Candidatus Omnitrophota bacterium]
MGDSISYKDRIVSLLNKILILLGTIFISIIIIEFTLKLFGYQPVYYYPKDLFIYDADLGYRLSPLFKANNNLGEFQFDININSAGLRDIEYNQQQKNMLSVLGLGDSFTFGTGVNYEDTYLHQLEEIIKASRVVCRVINAGVPGYGTKHELLFYRKYGLQYKSGIVLVGFNITNDPNDNLRDYSVKNGFIIEKKTGNNEPSASKFYILKSFLRTHSRLYSFIINRLKNNPKIQELLIRFNISINVFPIELQFYKKTSPSILKNEYQTAEIILKQLKKTCLENNAKLIIIGIPSQSQVYPDLWQKVKKLYGLKGEDYDLDLPNKIFSKVCYDNQIAFVDLLPLFRQYAQQGKKLYYKIDGHWNKEGHKAAAQIIYLFFKKHKYLESVNNIGREF